MVPVSGAAAGHRHITGKSTTLGGGAAYGWSLAQCRRLPGIDMSIQNGRRRHCVLLPDVMRNAVSQSSFRFSADYEIESSMIK